MSNYVRNKTSRHLTAQKRMAMELMKVGQRGVWLDPTRKDDLAKATTREQIRALIDARVIRRKKPRVGQEFVMPPQYMSRFRQRLSCDVAIRNKPRVKQVKPTSGKRYYARQYWERSTWKPRTPKLRLAAGEPTAAAVAVGSGQAPAAAAAEAKQSTRINKD